MALAKLDDIAPLLVCPLCRGALVREGTSLRCGSQSCRLGAAGAFAQIGRWPALADFSSTVLDQKSLAGPRGVVQPGTSRWSSSRVPRPVRSWWKPRNEVAARNVDLMLRLLDGPAPLVLVVGGGTVGNGIADLYVDSRPRVLAFDIYASALTHFIADAHAIPLASGSVDAVVIQAVLEHVLDPERVVAEIHRVLRPGGIVYAETPFLQHVHAGAYDFTRFTASGHRQLFRAFDQIAAGPVAGPGTVVVWSIDHLVRGLLRSELAGKLARLPFFWLRHLDRLVPMEFTMDSASAFFLLGRRGERVMDEAEIIAYYRGAQRSGSHDGACRP